MKSKDMIKDELKSKISEALNSQNEDALSTVFVDFASELQEEILNDAQAYKASNDQNILTSRGYRSLTSEETKYYSNLITAMKSNDTKSAITNIDNALPVTVLESVMEDLKTEFPLLDAIDFQSTGAMTKYVINNADTQKATWGALNTAITKELTGSVAVLDIVHNKLTAYMAVSQDMLAEGPVFVDKYVRGILAESLGLGFSDGIINGNGLNQPIGMIKDLSKSINPTTGYSDKTAESIKDLGAETFGKIAAKLAKVSTNRTRNVDEILFVVNPVTYFEKVLPAVTFLTSVGTYAKDVFPYNVKVVKDPAIAEGKAVFGLGKKYILCAGVGAKGGKVEYSDDYQFIDDLRTYKIKVFANGQPKDNAAFVYADISGLEPYVPTYKQKTDSDSK